MMTEAERELWIREQRRQAHWEAEREGLHEEDVDADTFKVGGRTIKLLEGDADTIPAAQLYYRVGRELVVGELTYLRALVERDGDDEGREEVIPWLVWTHHEEGVLHRHLRPYEAARELEVAGQRIRVELRTRYTKALETLMTWETIQRYRQGEEAPGWEELHKTVVSALKAFVDLGWDIRLYDVVACWVIGTYFIDLFRVYPQLYAYGSQGTGKSRLTSTAVLMSRHGFRVVDPSRASLYRMAEGLRPTLEIDEGLMGSEAWRISRAAFKRSLQVPRIEKTLKDRFILGLFETYMAIAMNSTRLPRELGGCEADEARCLIITMRRAPDPAGRDPEPMDFTHIRGQLYLARLLRTPEVEDAFREVAAHRLSLQGHQREAALPLLTVASLIGPDVYEAVLTWLWDHYAARAGELHWEEHILIGAMTRLLVEQPTLDGVKTAEFRASDLLSHIRAELEERGELSEAQFQRFWTPTRVGRILTRMGVSKRRTMRARLYSLTPKELEQLASRYDYPRHDTYDTYDASLRGIPRPQNTPERASKRASPGDNPFQRSVISVIVSCPEEASDPEATLRKRLRAAYEIGLRLQREKGGEAITTMEFYSALERELGLEDAEIKRLLDILMREGRCHYAPPNRLRFVGG
jgi:hypothetical protein